LDHLGRRGREIAVTLARIPADVAGDGLAIPSRAVLPEGIARGDTHAQVGTDAEASRRSAAGSGLRRIAATEREREAGSELVDEVAAISRSAIRDSTTRLEAAVNRVVFAHAHARAGGIASGLGIIHRRVTDRGAVPSLVGTESVDMEAEALGAAALAVHEAAGAGRSRGNAEVGSVSEIE
jgi:hypothetical protein